MCLLPRSPTGETKTADLFGKAVDLCEFLTCPSAVILQRVDIMPKGLMDWVESAQSITEINTQEEPTPQNNIDQQQQQAVAAAVDPYALDQLVRLGFTRMLAQGMLTRHGSERIREVLEQSRDTGIHNPAGFVRRALLENWVVKPQRPNLLEHDPMRYVTGKYAAFIEH